MEMFILNYANVLCIYPKLCLQVGSAFWAQNLLDKPVCYEYIVPLIYVNEAICMVICPSSRFKLIILWPKINHLEQDYPKIHFMGEGPGAILSFETFLSFINRLLVTI